MSGVSRMRGVYDSRQGAVFIQAWIVYHCKQVERTNHVALTERKRERVRESERERERERQRERERGSEREREEREEGRDTSCYGQSRRGTATSEKLRKSLNRA